MNIMLPARPALMKQLTQQTQALKFQRILPAELNTGDIVYIANGYEVVGHCILKNIIPLCKWLAPNKPKYPAYGCHYLMDYYLRHIQKDTLLADHVAHVVKQYGPILEQRYKEGYILQFVFSPQHLNAIQETGCPINTWKRSAIEAGALLAQTKKADELINQCDDWLSSIGYYDQFGESDFKFALALDNFIPYNQPISIFRFQDKKGAYLCKLTHNYRYVRTEPNDLFTKRS